MTLKSVKIKFTKNQIFIGDYVTENSLVDDYKKIDYNVRRKIVIYDKFQILIRIVYGSVIKRQDGLYVKEIEINKV